MTLGEFCSFCARNGLRGVRVVCAGGEYALRVRVAETGCLKMKATGSSLEAAICELRTVCAQVGHND